MTKDQKNKRDKKRHELAIERFRESWDYDRDDREKAREDLRFGLNHNGCQWPDGVRSAREEDPNGPRPCITINKIPEKIDIIDGEFRQVQPSPEIVPVDSGADKIKAEIVGGILRQIEYGSDARTTYNLANQSLLYSGRLAWRINTAKLKDNPFRKKIVIQPIPDVFSVFYDPHATKPDKSDGKFWFVTSMISKAEHKAKYPDCDISQFAGEDTEDVWHSENSVRIAEYWWKETDEENVHMVNRLDDSGNPVQLIVTDEQIRPGDEILDSTTQEKITVYHVKLNRNEFLAAPRKWAGEDIPIIFGVGKPVVLDGKSCSRGMIREAKDAQRMLNYWASTNTEQLALAPKSPYLVTPTMIGDFENVWNTAGQKNWPFLPFNPDPQAPQGPQRQSPPLPSSGILSEMSRLEHDIMSAMGVYRASLGDSSSEKSGKAIMARQRQGNIGTYAYTDTMNTCLTRSAQIIVNLIPYVYDVETVQRIRGDDGEEKQVPINARLGLQLPDTIDKDLVSEGQYLNDLTVGTYDVRVKIGPSYTTQREEAFSKIIELLSKVPSIIPAVIDLLVKNYDMPGSQEFIDRLKKLVPPELMGEDGQGPPGPTPEDIAKLKEMQLKEREQTRKEFATKAVAAKQFSEAEKIANDAQTQTE